MNNMVEYELGLMQILTNVLAADKSATENVELANDMLKDILTDILKQRKGAKIFKDTGIQIVQEIN